MWNILLDRLPDEYEGFKIDPSFRIGIQIFQLLNDDSFSESEKFSHSVNLLFLDVPPDIVTAQKGIEWFLSGWYTDNPGKGKDGGKKDMDYDIDQWRIYSAFLTQFRIDLNTADMHFWTFMGLLTTLEECAFTRIIDIRTRKINPKMDRDDKEKLKELKERYAIMQEEMEEMSEQERMEMEIFMQYAKAKN